MKKIKHISLKSILKGMILGIVVGGAILILSAYVKIPVSFSDIAILISIPTFFGAFAGYTIA